jgi:putative toxin-antitoxin system antitoxin component (TIGR02293 family)
MIPAYGEEGVMISANRIIDALGGDEVFHHQVRNELDWAKRIAEGLPVAVVDYMVRTNLLDRQEVFRLIVPMRTYDRRKGQRLSRDESDRAERIARMSAMAQDVFGNPDKAHRWLRKPNRALDGTVPLDLCQTDAGARLVETVLDRIAFGDFT